MLTATDFINLIQFYYSHSSYTAAIQEMDQFQISQLRGNARVILHIEEWHDAQGAERIVQLINTAVPLPSLLFSKRCRESNRSTATRALFTTSTPVSV